MAPVDTGGAAPLTVEVSRDRTEPVLRLRGELDISSLAILHDALDTVLDDRPTGLVFDLEDLQFMDSSGLAELLRAAVATSVRLRQPSQIVRRVIQLTGVAGLLPIEP
jgi:anti-sigma B factor antagonist